MSVGLGIMLALSVHVGKAANTVVSPTLTGVLVPATVAEAKVARSGWEQRTAPQS